MNMRRIAGIAIASACIATVPAFGQSNKSKSDKTDSRATRDNMTLVGCLMTEPDYRKAHGLGKGAIGGLGLSDEFVLVDAAESSSATAAPSSSSARCTETGTGT